MKRTGKKLPVIYLIGPEDMGVGRVKVGFSVRHPSARVSLFNTGSPFRLRIYNYFEGDQQDEMRLHRAFAGLSAHGEWFHMVGGLARFVRALDLITYSPVPIEEVTTLAVEHLSCGQLPAGGFFWSDGEGALKEHDPYFHLNLWLRSKGVG